MNSKIEWMHKYYGKCDSKCKSCTHLYGDTRCEASDWRIGWDACGLTLQDILPDGYVPICERIKHITKPPFVHEDQVSMWDDQNKEVSLNG